MLHVTAGEPFRKVREWCEKDSKENPYQAHTEFSNQIGSGEKTLRLLGLGDKSGSRI